MAVISPARGYDFRPPRNAPRKLDREVDRLPPANAIDNLIKAGRHQPGDTPCKRRLRFADEMMVADIICFHRCGDRGDNSPVSVPEIKYAAVRVTVDKPPAVHIPDVTTVSFFGNEYHVVCPV